MRKQFTIGSLGLLLCSSCLKEELPVPAHVQGDALEGQACIGADYGQQVWFDLSTNSIVSTNSKMDWDLAFECGAEGWQVRVNTSRFMRAVATAQADISQPLDTAGFGTLWRIDHNGGSADSTAIRDWRTDHPVYALDLGYTTAGLPMGVRELQVLSVDANGYSFSIAQMNGSGVQTFTVPKDPMRSYVHFSIASAQVVNIAPPLGTYDLVFAQYSYQFYDPLMAYLVTGATAGFSGTRVARILSDDFTSVDLTDTLDHPFISDEDGIGYDWKEYDFDAGVYTVFPDRVFLVQDAQGLFYKLHFTDFYNDLGERGCPTFEVVAF